MRTFKLINNNNKNESLVNNLNKKNYIDVVCYNPNGNSLNPRYSASRKVKFSSLPHINISKPASKSKRVLPTTPNTKSLFNMLVSSSGHFTPEPDPDHDIGTLSSKYGLDRGDTDHASSPPKSPPPFSKAESRFEREQRIKVGSLDSYTPGGTLQRQKR